MGSTENDRKVPLVRWETCCKPHLEGGLGLKRLVPQNTSFLMKVAFQLVTKLDTFWVLLLRAKYKMADICPVSIAKPSCSYVWRSIVKVWDRFRDRIRWRIGNDRCVNFLQDDWVHNLGKLANYLLPGSNISSNAKVVEIVRCDSGWNWLLLRLLFPVDILQHIRACFPPNDTFRADMCSWKLNSNGSFTVKTVYHSLVLEELSLKDTSWNYIWEGSLPPKIKYFLWLVRSKRLLTNSERARRGLSVDTGYALCGAAAETLSHVLRDCNLARRIWLQVVSQGHSHMFFNMELEDWLMSNLRGKVRMRMLGVEDVICFVVTCWLIWKQRKEFSFQQHMGSI